MKIPCPKCSAPNTDLYQDSSPGQFRGYPHNAVLHCIVCGHRTYGLPALQYAQSFWLQAREEERERKRLEQEAQLRQAEAAIAAAKEAQEREAKLERRRARDRAYQKRKYWARKAQAEQPAVPDSVCAWEGCSNPQRETSKYCSRGCSNKNARARAKQRKSVA